MASDLADAIVRLAVDQRDHPAQRFQLDGRILMINNAGDHLFADRLVNPDNYPKYMPLRLTTYENGVGGPSHVRAPDLWVKPMLSERWIAHGSTFSLTEEKIPMVAKHIVSLLNNVLMGFGVEDPTSVTRIMVLFGRTGSDHKIQPAFQQYLRVTVPQLRNKSEEVMRSLAEMLRDLVVFVNAVSSIDSF